MTPKLNEMLSSAESFRTPKFSQVCLQLYDLQGISARQRTELIFNQMLKENIQFDTEFVLLAMNNPLFINKLDELLVLHNFLG